MKSTNHAYAAVAAILVAVAPATPAFAVSDSYISAAGNDASSCAINVPCASMAHAVSQTQAGGVLHCLDSGDYAGATITQSITIDCSNTTAGAGPFTINGSGITVHIRGLAIWEFATGINFENGAALYVENCLIFGNTYGIQASPTAAANLSVVNSTIRTNASGVLIKPGVGGSVAAVFNGVTISNNNGGGLKTDTTNGPVSVDISNSTITNNAGNGVNAISGAGGQNNMLNIKNSVIARNGSAGVQANGANAAALVNNTLLDSNTAGATSSAGGGRILTYGNNSIVGFAGSGFTGTAPLN
jgi:hypothetical protein